MKRVVHEILLVVLCIVACDNHQRFTLLFSMHLYTIPPCVPESPAYQHADTTSYYNKASYGTVRIASPTRYLHCTTTSHLHPLCIQLLNANDSPTPASIVQSQNICLELWIRRRAPRSTNSARLTFASATLISTRDTPRSTTAYNTQPIPATISREGVNGWGRRR